MITAAQQLARANAMERLPEAERNVAIGAAGNLIDARHRFDPDRMEPGLADLFKDAVTVTVFEGSYGPGEGDLWP